MFVSPKEKKNYAEINLSVKLLVGNDQGKKNMIQTKTDSMHLPSCKNSRMKLETQSDEKEKIVLESLITICN